MDDTILNPKFGDMMNKSYKSYLFQTIMLALILGLPLLAFANGTPESVQSLKLFIQIFSLVPRYLVVAKCLDLLIALIKLIFKSISLSDFGIEIFKTILIVVMSLSVLELISFIQGVS